MAKASTPKKGRLLERRPYESELRRAQTAATKSRILAAGSALAHRAHSWDWSALTHRAVAAQAGVSERTVYRHFATERQLHEALLRQLEQEAGVQYEGLRVEDLSKAAARLFESLPSFAAAPVALRSQISSTRDQVRRDSILRVVHDITPSWSEAQRQMAAAILDAIGTPPVYERLVAGWRLSTQDAARAATWAVDVIVKAIRDGETPEAKSSEANGKGSRVRKSRATRRTVGRN
jgi:AcrR family transcriptional regulator